MKEREEREKERGVTRQHYLLTGKLDQNYKWHCFIEGGGGGGGGGGGLESLLPPLKDTQEPLCMQDNSCLPPPLTSPCYNFAPT